MKNRILLFLIGLCLGPPAWSQTQSPYLFTRFPSWSATATSQTSPVMALSSTTNQVFSYSTGTVNVVGSSLTTTTFSVLGSQDYGVTYYALVIQQCGVSGGSSTTATATANGCYWVNLAGIDHLKFQTSGTFTATSVAFTMRANPNVQNAGGGAGGGGATFPFPGVVYGDSATTGHVATESDILSIVPGTPIGQYSGGVTYKLGDFVWDASGNYYQSLASANTGNALPVLPTQATSFWRFVAPNAGIIAGGICTNQFASAISTAGVPTCTTVTPAYAAGNTTGSGNFVLTTSPTLVTPALGTPTALVLTSATGLPTAGLVNNAVTSAKMAVANTYRTCDIPINDTSGSAITSGQMGPQSRVCFIPAAATIVEMDVNADAGTPNIIVGRNHAGTITNIVSGALATAASGGIACSNTGGTTGINGATTCSGTLQNTSLAAGDYLELVSGTSGGTAKFFVAHVIYTVN